MVIIPNQKLIKTLDKTIPYQKSLEIVNDVLYRGVQVSERWCILTCEHSNWLEQCISDLIVRPGLINLDFADIKAVMEVLYLHISLALTHRCYRRREEAWLVQVRHTSLCIRSLTLLSRWGWRTDTSAHRSTDGTATNTARQLKTHHRSTRPRACHCRTWLWSQWSTLSSDLNCFLTYGAD